MTYEYRTRTVFRAKHTRTRIKGRKSCLRRENYVRLSEYKDGVFAILDGLGTIVTPLLYVIYGKS